MGYGRNRIFPRAKGFAATSRCGRIRRLVWERLLPIRRQVTRKGFNPACAQSFYVQVAGSYQHPVRCGAVGRRRNGFGRTPAIVRPARPGSLHLRSSWYSRSEKTDDSVKDSIKACQFPSSGRGFLPEKENLWGTSVPRWGLLAPEWGFSRFPVGLPGCSGFSPWADRVGVGLRDGVSNVPGVAGAASGSSRMRAWGEWISSGPQVAGASAKSSSRKQTTGASRPLLGCVLFYGRKPRFSFCAGPVQESSCRYSGNVTENPLPITRPNGADDRQRVRDLAGFSFR